MANHESVLKGVVPRDGHTLPQAANALLDVKSGCAGAFVMDDPLLYGAKAKRG
jgi:ABC-type amino acid transport substrate-binding protein